MSWEDEYELEYTKFDTATFEDSVLYEDVEVLYCKVGWNTLEEYTNQWNKLSKRMVIKKYRRFKNGEGSQRFDLLDMEFYLSIGARLFNALKKFKKENPKSLIMKIMRTGKNFDTIYFIHKFTPPKKI